MTIAMNRLYRTALAAALTLTTASLRAADETVCESPEASEPLSSRTIRLKEAVVTGRRLADIGVTKMNLDSVALRQNVTNSLGDLLSQSTPVFIKSYGRGTMATASFRGTAPSHTQVTWNGMKINSPMLGMVDFSLIPSYFIDEASLYHGAGSVGVSGGGLGGAITLGTKPLGESGAGVHFIQGISSFDTYDEFLRFTYGTRKFESSTRVCYVTSDNDFKYRNYDKYEQIDGQWVYPMERNKNCSYRDFHLLQEFYYQPDERNRFGLAAWVTDSRRGIPMLTVDYKQEGQARSTQDETTLRAVASWDRRGDGLKMGAKAGYIYSYILYRYDGNPDPDSGELQQMIHSHSRINTGYGQFYAEYYPTPKWALTANASVNVHSVSSLDDPDLGGAQPEDTIRLGYDKVRAEVSLLATVKYRPHPRLGLGIDLRGESYGRNLTPLIPAGFVDYTLWPRFGVVLKASVARNYRYPSLNDLYFKPGGNDSLKTEKGYTYEGGMEFRVKEGVFDFGGEVTVYNSHIRDAAQRQEGAQLRRRAPGRLVREAGTPLGIEPERFLGQDPLDQLGRSERVVRPVDRQAARLCPRIFFGRYRKAFVARIRADLPVQLLQRALYDIEQRERIQSLFTQFLLHERSGSWQDVPSERGRAVRQTVGLQPVRRGVRFGAFPADARPQFRSVHRHHAALGQEKALVGQPVVAVSLHEVMRERIRRSFCSDAGMFPDASYRKKRSGRRPERFFHKRALVPVSYFLTQSVSASFV